MDKVRIGFVGVGGMGQCAHLKNYVTLPDCEVVAIAEIREELGRKVAQKYGVSNVYTSSVDMLANEDLNGIVASQPFTRHGAVVPELLGTNLPIFTEKPLAGSVEVGKKILEALNKSKSWYMVGYHKRSDPATMYAKAEIDRLKETNELGALRYVRILMPAGDWIAGGFNDLVNSNEPYPELDNDPSASDMDPQTYAEYITFVNFYIHQVNFMRHMLGEDYKVTYADPSQVLLAVQSESGIAGTIEMSPYQTSIDWQETILVCFERGYVKIDLPAPLANNRPGHVEILRDPGNEKTPQTIVPQLPSVHAMRQQAMNFVAAIRGEMKPMCVASEAYKDLVVARDYIRLLKGM